MNVPRNSDIGVTQAASGRANLPGLRVLGFPGAFVAWGVECVRQILASNGYAPQISPLDQVSPDSDDAAADAAVAVHILLGHGPVMTPAGTMASAKLPTIVFLDTPAWPVHELLSSGQDPMDAVRMLTATLAPLAAVLREDGVLLLRRTREMDLSATQSAIASHLSATRPLPSGVLAACATIDTSSPPPQLVGQALSLTRQVLTPLTNLVTGAAHDTLVWPLACFYSGDYPGELASPLMEVVGPARVLYYGPYFHLPRGRWRAEVELFVSGTMRDKMLAIDVFAGEELARRQFRPADGGLLLVSLSFVVDRAEDRLEMRVWLLAGAIEGYLGLRHVSLHPVEGEDQ